MYLKKLEIYGFKSFAKKTVLEFELGITSIVGPNGSGKSNVADSLRWVFGEQSMKLLRGKKSEDVIFAGSDHKPRLGVAEVAIHFDNADHRMPIDYDEVVIMRRMYRDGNSEYIINGNPVRLLDIQDLLAKSGFGNTSYHVIGQGMIDQLVAGGPAAIKELLEEASGVKPYYTKRERTLRRLERTGNNLGQIQALVSEIEPRLRSLRRQTRRLEQRADVEQELRLAQAMNYGQVLRGLNLQIGEVSAKVAIFDKQIAELNKEIGNLSREVQVHEQETPRRSKIYQKIRADLEILQSKKLELQEELATIRGKLKVTEGNNHKVLGIDLEELRAKFQSAYQRLLNLLKKFDPNEAAVVQTQFAEIAAMLEGKKSASESSDSPDNLRSHEEKLNQDLAGFLQRIKALEEDLSSYTKQEEEMKQQLFVKERLLRNKQDILLKTVEQKNLLSVEEAKFLTRKEAQEEEAKTELGPKYQELIAEAQSTAVPLGLLEKIQSLKKQLAMIGGVDDLVQQEYRETEDRYQYLTTQSADLEKGVADLRTVIAELDEVIKKEFNDAFAKISEKFAEYFRLLFNGGRAAMTILRQQPRAEFADGEEGEENSDEQSVSVLPAAKTEIVGIDIKATPPGKKLGGISALSGGERALTSIALLSAILATYPSPFVVLDEVDAALDEANSIRFGKIVGTLAHRTQFITITHNRETMRQSHTLYGVTMGDDGISKILSLKLEQAAVYSTKN